MFEKDLEQLERNGLRRVLRVVEPATDGTVVVNGRKMVLFGSNDYLGLADHPAVKKAVIDSVEKYGWGGGASRLVCGNMTPHAEFESKIATFLDKPAALLFNSGYSTNVGILTALLDRHDTVFADRLCHASILDGARWSGARLKRFAHNDPDSLKKILDKHTDAGKKMIVTEGVFSMDGDLAPLGEIAELADKYGAVFMVDDAHGFGVFGPNGRGTVHMRNVAERVDIHVITLGKAMGGAGGVVAGTSSLINGLINFSRSFVYSTAIPPAAASGAMAALDIVSGDEGDALREALSQSVKNTALIFKRHCISIDKIESQIIPVFADSDSLIVPAANYLMDEGFFVPAIRPPTVPKGTGRFRLSITATHKADDIKRLAELLRGMKNNRKL